MSGKLSLQVISLIVNDPITRETRRYKTCLNINVKNIFHCRPVCWRKVDILCTNCN